MSRLRTWTGCGQRARGAILSALLAVAACAIGLRGTATAGGDGLDGAIAKARSTFVSRLQSLASWCDDQRIAGVRDRVYEKILRLDPDHERARTVLRFRRAAKGAPWVQDPDYRTPTDFNKGMIPDAEQRLAAAGAEYRNDVLGALDGAGEAVPASQKDGVLEALVDLLPDDRDLRVRHGDVQVGRTWMLPESAESPARRRELQARAAELAKQEPAPVESRRALAMGWKFAYAVDGWTVYGSTPAGEGLEIATRLAAARRFAADVLGDLDFGKREKEVIVLPDRTSARALLAKHPDEAASRQLEFGSGLWMSSGAFLAYWEDTRWRALGIQSAVVALYLDGRYRTSTRGWLVRGVIDRLLWYVEGDVGPGAISIEGTSTLREKSDDDPPREASEWIAAAAKAVDRGGPVEFRTLLTRSINGMRGRDVLAAYGLAAYLLEARPESFGPFAQAATELDDADEMARRVFAVDATALYWRVRRWLMEQR